LGGIKGVMDSLTDKYVIGQPLYGASVDEMHAWVDALDQEIIRLKSEIEKKKSERDKAESIFNKLD